MTYLLLGECRPLVDIVNHVSLEGVWVSHFDVWYAILRL